MNPCVRREALFEVDWMHCGERPDDLLGQDIIWVIEKQPC